MTAVTICDTREKLQNCPLIATKGNNLAKKGKYEPSSAFDSVTICDHEGEEARGRGVHAKS